MTTKKKQEGIIRLGENLSLLYRGVYTEGDGDVNYSSNFEIISLDIKDGSVIELLEWSFTKDPLWEIEGLIIKQIEEEMFESK